MNPKETAPRPKTRRRRAAVTLAATAVAALSLAGTAGATSVWEDVWAQIRPLLADSGTINSPENPVDWTKLKSVPAGLADGLDNGVDRAGFGLKKNIYPNVEFAVDGSKVQQRVNGSCPAGQAVRSIAQDGRVTCSTGPKAFSTHSVDTGIVCRDWCTEGSLDLPPGSYAVTAKIEARGARVFCRLDWNGSVIDQSRTTPSGSEWTPVSTLPLQAVLTNVGPGTLSVVCHNQAVGDATAGELQITAIRVA